MNEFDKHVNCVEKENKRAMMREIIQATFQYSKGIIESGPEGDCPLTSQAFEEGQITSGQIERFIQECAKHLLTEVQQESPWCHDFD